jgi:cellulose synthase operon protein C
MPLPRRLLLPFLCWVGFASAPLAQDEGDADDPQQILQQAQQKYRRGELSAATGLAEELLELLAEEPELAGAEELAAAGRALLWRIGLRRGGYEAVEQSIGALPEAQRLRREALLVRGEALARVGRYGDAIELAKVVLAKQADDGEAQHRLGVWLWADGQRTAAQAAWQAHADAALPSEAVALAWRGRSLVRLGGRQNLEAASQVLVAALQQAPDLAIARIAYGQAKFAAYGEASGFPSGEKDLNKVLAEHGDDEEALLALYAIRSANAVLDAGKTERLLDRVLDRNERCVEALVHRGSNVLDDRRYQDAARVLDTALAVDPNDRIALCHRAAAAWLLHDQAGYAKFRARALAGDTPWHECDRILAEHLVALYRFADALPFFDAAENADPEDLATLHGKAKALVYSGRGAAAKEVLVRAKALANGINDPWRNNALAIQDLLDTEYTVVENERFVVQMHRDDVEVLQSYLLPLQLEAAEVLGAKYSWQPSERPRIEVLHTWDDFSVRTVGFRGFTALGACFGGLTTLVSPNDGDLRQQDFMWEATAWHEYVHVLTLGVSNHRVPRWLTEGFSVYEEKVRDPAWERGMDRELFDAFANSDIPPVHLLNRLFRGPRILFGYYQGGLIVELIARDFGFAKALALLRAFGEDLDTEAAFQQALGLSSRDFDARFLEFVQRERLRGMRLVPRLDERGMQRALTRAQQDKRAVQPRIDLAWACVQRDNPVDAGRWLAEVERIEPASGQAQLVRAALLAARKDLPAAIECWQRGFAAGADDFDSRMRCAAALAAGGEIEAAIDMLQRAKACWPNCTEQESAPELRLAKLYKQNGDATQAQMEMKAYCRRTARAFQPRYELATLAGEAGDHAEQIRYLVECNRIDPFHRELHERLAAAYVAVGKPAAAAREFEVAAAVQPALDRQNQKPDSPPVTPAADAAARGQLWLEAARLRDRIGDRDRAVELLERIGKEAPTSEAAAAAASLLAEWRAK